MSKNIYDIIEEAVKNKTFKHSITGHVYEIDGITIYNGDLYIRSFNKNEGKYVNFDTKHFNLLKEMTEKEINLRKNPYFHV